MAKIVLRVKTKSGQQVINSLTKNNTIKDLKEVLSNLSSIPVSRLHVLCGFPPKVFNIAQDDLNLNDSGLNSGDTLILEEKATVEPVVSSLQNNELDTTIEQRLELPTDGNLYNCPGILMKHVVPADNSCLFTSVHFVLNGKVDETGEAAPFLRQLVAESIRNESHKYDAAILGKPVEEYCSWIQDDKSWGGAIELAILSSYYGIEIAVVDTINAIINRFGEDQNFPLRVFLMFDGIHYDPLYLETLNGDSITTFFETTNEMVLREAELLAQEAKSSRQFTDVNKFTLKCLVCNTFLKGQVEAQHHAKATSHMNFGEV
ncbi:ubiquitin thioesterase Otu1 isoform X2 [Cylas formicarius]|nr:ubiquitin thioesterase Otu1 isoform X2 [Cylas formicarius]